MRFVVFFNNHPKINAYQVRTWDNATVFQNHIGEMTHPDFIRYCRIDFNQVSLMGDVIYNETEKQWCFDKKRPVIFLGTDENRKKQDKLTVLKYINEHFSYDQSAIQQSLREQEEIKRHRILSHLRFNHKAEK